MCEKLVHQIYYTSSIYEAIPMWNSYGRSNAHKQYILTYFKSCFTILCMHRLCCTHRTLHIQTIYLHRYSAYIVFNSILNWNKIHVLYFVLFLFSFEVLSIVAMTTFTISDHLRTTCKSVFNIPLNNLYRHLNTLYIWFMNDIKIRELIEFCGFCMCWPFGHYFTWIEHLKFYIQNISFCKYYALHV